MPSDEIPNVKVYADDIGLNWPDYKLWYITCSYNFFALTRLVLCVLNDWLSILSSWPYPISDRGLSGYCRSPHSSNLVFAEASPV